MPDGHKCKRLHGHNYEVRVWLEARELDANGMVRDFADLKVFASWLKTIYDHRCINDVLTGVHPTAENLARHFYEHIRDRFPVVKVRVYETDGAYAEYIGEVSPDQIRVP